MVRRCHLKRITPRHQAFHAQQTIFHLAQLYAFTGVWSPFLMFLVQNGTGFLDFQE